MLESEARQGKWLEIELRQDKLARIRARVRQGKWLELELGKG